MNVSLILFMIISILSASVLVSAYSAVPCPSSSQVSCSSVYLTNSTIDVGQSTQVIINNVSGSGIIFGNWTFSGSNIISSNTVKFIINASYLGNWQKQSNNLLPYNISFGQSCNILSNTIYCIGGYDNNNGTIISNVLVSSITTSGLTPWNSINYPHYPYSVIDKSCVTFKTIIYCIGGNKGVGDQTGGVGSTPNYNVLNSVYYSNVSNSTHSWSTNASYNYPKNIYSTSCNIYNSIIYCVGGANETSNVVVVNSTYSYTNYYFNGTNMSYYSVIGPSGIPGNWLVTNSYPSNVANWPTLSCNIYNATIYCLGQKYVNYLPKNTAYYASLSSNGIGTWTSTTPYPDNISGESCNIYNATIYCINGEINTARIAAIAFSAPVTKSGIGNWSFDSSITPESYVNNATLLDINTPCVTFSATLYCVSGSLINEEGASGGSSAFNWIYTANIIKPNMTIQVYAYSDNQINITYARGLTTSIYRNTNSISNQNFGLFQLSANINNSNSKLSLNNIPQINIGNAPSASANPSNAITDIGQKETYTISETGGTGPFNVTLYNFSSFVGASINYGSNIINEGQNAIFSFTSNRIGNRDMYARIADIGSGNYIFDTPINTIITNPDPTVSIIPSKNSIVFGQNDMYTVSILNGTGPFAAELYNINSSSQSGSNIIVQKNLGSYNTITVGSDPLSVAISPSGTFGYVANNQSNTISVINTITNTITSTINVGVNPKSVAINPSGSTAYVANYGSNTISVINTSSSSVTSTISVGVSPIYTIFNPSGSTAYVANYGSNAISVINTSSSSVTSISVGDEPYSIALNPSGSTAYVANYGSNDVSVINTQTNTVTATIGVGIKPTSVAISPSGTFGYVTNYGNGTISIINTTSNSVSNTIKLSNNIFKPINALYIKFNPTGTLVYAAEYLNSLISIISPTTNTIISQIPVSSLPTSIAFNPSGSEIYITNAYLNQLKSVPTGVDTINFTPYFTGIQAYKVIVTDYGTTTPYVVDSSTNSIYVTPGSTPTITLSSSNKTTDTGQYETLTATVNGGSGTFNAEIYNISGHQQLGSNIIINAAGGSNSITFKTGNTGMFTYNVIGSQVGNIIASENAIIQVNSQLSSISISPISAILDNGQALSITSSISGGTPPYTYKWYSGSSFICSSDTNLISSVSSTSTSSTISKNPTLSTYYCLNITDNASTPVSLYSADSHVIVNTLPSILLSQSNSTLDLGQYDTYKITMNGGTGPFDVYLYNITDNHQLGSTASISSSQSNTITFKPSSTGNYLFNASFTDTGTTSPFIGSSSRSITIVNPNILFSSIALTSNQVNKNNPLTISATVTGGTPPYTYTFYVYNSLTNVLATQQSYATSLSSNSFSFITGIPAQYYTNITVVDSASTPERVNSIKQTFIVLNNGALSVQNPSVTYTKLDQGQQSTLSASALGGVGPYTYKWYEEAPSQSSYNLISGATSTNYVFSTTSSTTQGTYNFLMQVTDTGQNPNVIANSTPISINVAPSLSIIQTIPTNTVQYGTPLLIDLSSSGGTSPYTYNYAVYNSITNTLYSNTTYTTSSTSNSFEFTGVSGQYYSIGYVSDSASIMQKNESSRNIFNILPLIRVSNPVANTLIDVGQSVTLSSIASGGTGQFSYQWYQKSPSLTTFNKVFSATTNIYTFTSDLFADTGTYTFLLQATDTGQSSNNIINSTPISIVINPQLSVPTISLSSNNVNTTTALAINSTVLQGTKPYTYTYNVYNGTSNSLVLNHSYTTSLSSNSFKATIPDIGMFYAIVSVVDSANLSVSTNSQKIYFNVTKASTSPGGSSSPGSGGGGGGGGSGGSGGGGGSITKKVVPNINIGGYKNRNVTLIYNNSSVIISAYNISNPDNIIELTINQTLENYSGSLSFGLTTMNYTMKKKEGRYNITALSVAGNKRTFILTITNNSTKVANFLNNLNSINATKTNSTATKNSTRSTNSIASNSINNNATRNYFQNLNFGKNQSITVNAFISNNPILIAGNNFTLKIYSNKTNQKINVTINNKTGDNYATPKNYIKKLILNVTIKSSNTIGLFINESAACPSKNIVPFEYANNSWQTVQNYNETYKNGLCVVSLKYGGMLTGIFAPVVTTSKPTGAITNTTTISSLVSKNNQSTANQNKGISINTIYDLLIAVTFAIILYLLYHITKLNRTPQKINKK